MGGDFGPRVAVRGALEALDRHPQLNIVLVGDERAISEQLPSNAARYGSRLLVEHAESVIAMDEKPSSALRNKRDSSLWQAIELVNSGGASGCVSAGNTGALMAVGRYLLKTHGGIDRPAMVTAMPTQSGHCYLLDIGANVDSNSHHLLQFAVMGSVLAESVDGTQSPRVGLLNIGHEDIKGNEQVKQANMVLAQQPNLNYIGYVEADAVYSGVADVVVCDGFVGNVLLKASEGTASLIASRIRSIFTSSWYFKFVGLMGLPLVNQLRKQMDPGRYNGATFLGLAGVLVKSHGNVTPRSFRYAIERAMYESENNLPERICKGLDDAILE
ncbi:MAG: phosphate acyltransferase PlsX [Cellvibrionaceae bacterium]